MNPMLNKMSRHSDQMSIQSDAHTDELQLAVLTRQNNTRKRLLRDIKPIEVTRYQTIDELNLLSYY